MDWTIGTLWCPPVNAAMSCDPYGRFVGKQCPKFAVMLDGSSTVPGNAPPPHHAMCTLATSPVKTKRTTMTIGFLNNFLYFASVSQTSLLLVFPTWVWLLDMPTASKSVKLSRPKTISPSAGPGGVVPSETTQETHGQATVVMRVLDSKPKGTGANPHHLAFKRPAP